MAADQHLRHTIFISFASLFRQKEVNKSFAVGHFAFGYIFGKFVVHATKSKLNIPLILTLSVLPDIDILIPFLKHRGPSHSIVTAVIIFIPVFVMWRKKAVPYFISLIQHSLIGDFITGGKTQLLWPLTSQDFGLEIGIKSLINTALEWVAFLAAVIVMLKTLDFRIFLQPHNSNLLLVIPIFTVLLPTFLAFPLDVPLALLPPHLVFLILFLVSLLIDFKRIFGARNRRDKYAEKN